MQTLVSKWTHSNLLDFLGFFTLSSHLHTTNCSVAIFYCFWWYRDFVKTDASSSTFSIAEKSLKQWLKYLLFSVLMISLVSKWTHSNLSDFLEFFTLSSHWDLLLLLMLSWLCQNWRHLEPLCALGCENLMNVLTFRNGCECTYIRASSISEFQTGHPN